MGLAGSILTGDFCHAMGLRAPGVSVECKLCVLSVCVLSVCVCGVCVCVCDVHKLVLNARCACVEICLGGRQVSTVTSYTVQFAR